MNSKFTRCAGCEDKRVMHSFVAGTSALHSSFAVGEAIDFTLYRIDAA